jgi:ATP-dependent RNA helicase DeaD
MPTHTSLARALLERNYNDPTPVQTAVLEPQADGRDLLVSAQTGSGKTVAYGLAIAKSLLGEAEFFGEPSAPVALVVAPTRELALQVQNELTWLYQYSRARVVSCVGGMDPRQERRLLSDGVHIVVGTPGRLRDHLERGALKVSGLKALVIDEADEMLDLGFRDDLEFILQTTPAERRTLLFSATLPKAIVTLAKHYQRDALRIQPPGEQSGHADIEYRALRIAAHDVEHAIVNVLRFIDPPSALVFCNTRESVRHLQATLLERGFSAVALSGELSQSERNHALQALRDGRARVCVATDVAARGIDLPQLGLVIHADLPNDAEVLQHRSGRTGRAGRKGVSILLVPPASRRRAAQLLSSARIAATWDVAPSPEAIHELDQERFLKNSILNEPADEDDLAFARVLLAQRSAEDLAAALVRLHRTQLPAAEDLLDPGGASDKAGPHADKRGKRAPREPFRKRGASERQGDRSEDRVKGVTRAPMKAVWFRLDIGRRKNADPKWLVPINCRKGNVTKQDIGVIRIFDNETKFEIDERMAEQFAQNVRNAPRGDGNIEPSSAPGSRTPGRYSAAQEALSVPRKEVHGTSKHKSVFAPARERDGERGKVPRAKPGRAKFGGKPKSAKILPQHTGRPPSDRK